MMQLFENPAVIWFGLGLLLLLAELLIPGLIVVFFGVAAWLTALAYLAFDLSFNQQLVVFIVTSLVNLAILRRLVVKYWWRAKEPQSELSSEFIGKSCLVVQAIHPGPEGGKVSFRGTTWTAHAAMHIGAGETVQIRGKESITLFVEPLH